MDSKPINVSSILTSYANKKNMEQSVEDYKKELKSKLERLEEALDKQETYYNKFSHNYTIQRIIELIDNEADI